MENRDSGWQKFELNSKVYNLIWEVCTLSSPMGATVLVMDITDREKNRQVYRRTGQDFELAALIEEAKKTMNKDAAG